jgi:transcriptional regulator with XRE-family HTH domain
MFLVMEELALRVGERIRLRRIDVGLSQEKLAARAGLTARTVARIELGEEARLGSIAAIADALGVNLADLVAAA